MRNERNTKSFGGHIDERQADAIDGHGALGNHLPGQFGRRLEPDQLPIALPNSLGNPALPINMSLNKVSAKPVAQTDARSRLTRLPRRSSPKFVRRRVSGPTWNWHVSAAFSTTVRHAPLTATLSPTVSSELKDGTAMTSRRPAPSVAYAVDRSQGFDEAGKHWYSSASRGGPEHPDSGFSRRVNNANCDPRLARRDVPAHPDGGYPVTALVMRLRRR